MKPDYIQTEKSKLSYYIIGCIVCFIVMTALIVGEVVMLTDQYNDSNQFLTEEIVIGLFALTALLGVILLIRGAVQRNQLLKVETYGRHSVGTVVERKLEVITNSDSGVSSFNPFVWYTYFTDNREKKLCKEKVSLAEYNIIDAVCNAGNLELPILQLGNRAVIDIKTVTGS